MKKMSLILTLIASMATNSVYAQTNASSASSNSNQAVWSGQYGGADKSDDQQLLDLRKQIAPLFQQFEFNDPKTGQQLAYNLYIPQDYDPQKSYPLVLFMADASTVGKGVTAPLMQGYGGIIWATPEFQAEHAAFVLVPAYQKAAVNDQWQTSDEVSATLNLLQDVMKRYSIDSHRLYTTGQSMGGMMSFYFNATYPDLFAASLYVGSQWDINVLAPLARQKFFYIVSAGDSKASKGMAELRQLLSQQKANVGEVQFSARLPESEQNAKVEALIAEGHPINLVQFDANTVIPEGKEAARGGEHMYSFDYAYLIPAVREWLFAQSK